MNKRLELPTTPTLACDDTDLNTSANPSFMQVLDARLSRRSLLRGGMGTAASVVLGSWSLTGCGGGDGSLLSKPEPQPAPITELKFTPVAKATADAVSVAAGYTATVIYALGDPLSASTPAYANDGTDSDWENRAGDHHDGMEWFGLAATGNARDPASNTRGLLVMNHEATSHAGNERASAFIHPNGGTNTLPRPASEVDKEVAIHGLSSVEVRKGSNGAFATVQSGALNRRVTPLTPVELSGPVRGNALAKTRYSPSGTGTRGTLNNCGTGVTPWGTFLSGEENWAGYFTRSASDNAARGDKSVTSLNRYGRTQGAASRHGWETGGSEDKYARWNISKLGTSTDGSDDYRNELNGFGYIVEMDPYDKSKAIKKRTALGRFAHESAAFGKLVAGQPLQVYMGDDSRGEYIYKFVSAANWSEADATASDRMATGDKYLDAGKLYVAKFNEDGTGAWLELSMNQPAIANYAGYAFSDLADICANSRLAADAVGATRMDRPEWCAVHPGTGEIYYTLTNNSNRKVEPASSSQARVDAANPRSYSDSYAGGTAGSPGNVNGHILRMKEGSGVGSFSWDVYLFGAEAGADTGKVNLSSLTADNDFSSPDGLWFSSSTGLCFIQTDDGGYTDVTNCMMLIGVPGSVGDGSVVPLSYAKADGSTLTVNARVGLKPAPTKLKRFLVGPKDCEITGCTETPDGKALFVNIQHPGETVTSAGIANPAGYLSHWPGNAGYGAGGANARPRSATIVITRNDGGRIGE
jgi:secreted PhoX family phosphatase